MIFEKGFHFGVGGYAEYNFKVSQKRIHCFIVMHETLFMYNQILIILHIPASHSIDLFVNILL